MIYLASTSPRRREILRWMKIPFRTVPSRYHEHTPRASRSPARTAMRNALGKAELAKVPTRRGWVLGADTLIYFNRRIFGKPRTRGEATRMLKIFSGKTHQVYTAVALIDLETGEKRVRWARTHVTFYRLNAATIRRYLSRVDPFDKAGAYAVQSGQELIRNVRGSYTNVMGLPMELLRTLIPRPLPACR